MATTSNGKFEWRGFVLSMAQMNVDGAAHPHALGKRWLSGLCNPYLGTDEQQGSAPELRRLCIVVKGLNCTKQSTLPTESCSGGPKRGQRNELPQRLGSEIVEQLPTKLM